MYVSGHFRLPNTKKANPEELITAQVNKAMEALKAKNIDGVLEIYSEKFEHYEWTDKAGFREFLQQSVMLAIWNDLEIDLSKMQVKNGRTNTGTSKSNRELKVVSVLQRLS
jgi:hypothetical protein